MGTWGSGNLDSDGALDAVGTASDALARRIWTRLRRRASAQADEYDYDVLFVDLETALALHGAQLFSPAELPAADAFDAAVAKWLARWDAYLDELQPAEGFKAERRAVIEDTFARYRAVVVASQD